MKPKGTEPTETQGEGAGGVICCLACQKKPTATRSKAALFTCAGDGDDQDQRPLQGQDGGTAAVHQEEDQRYQVQCKLSATIPRSLYVISP